MGKFEDHPHSERHIHPVVFPVGAAIILIFVILGIAIPEQVGKSFNVIQNWITEKFSWLYILTMTGFVFFSVYLIFSKFGHIKLGHDDETPDFNRITWFAMLFSAGMGIGLLFYSVAEPLMHFESPPTGEGHTLAAARKSMALTFFHWGFHPWACYAVIALVISYFGFRRGLPLSLRSAFYPLIGNRIHGWPGNVIDILAICSTLFGLATSLGLGAMQVNGGMNYVFGLDMSVTNQIIIIACITAVATISVLSGLEVGIRRLSELNMGIAAFLLLFVFLIGPTFYLLHAFVENFGAYLQHLPEHSFWTGTFSQQDSQEWLGGWTIFYWAWWIAWSPFVGMFIARISRGRTIREFMLATLIVPTVMGGAWLTIFGTTAIYQDLTFNTGLAEMVSQNPADIPKALFMLLDQYPMATITSFLATCCVILFFVTSSDSASMVIDIIASGGNPDPPRLQRFFWAVTEGLVAIALLYAGGKESLNALQTAVITTALPFSLVLIVMCYSLIVGLNREIRYEEEGRVQELLEETRGGTTPANEETKAQAPSSLASS